ncbi:MAG: hypothetical protein SFX19_01660 [Alphaproteobacteria bacterium]|nr:hypothetical protein [Alphaproteobacteria bacterium]
MKSAFPSLPELRGLFTDHPIDAFVYESAKQLYETRPLPRLIEGPAIASGCHLRECVQLALCEMHMRGQFHKKGYVSYAA